MSGAFISNPADSCRLPPAKAREMRVLTPEEIQRLLIQAKEDGCFELLLLELFTGLRRGELCALQWNNLNFRTGELRVERQVHRVRGELVLSPPKTKAFNRSVILPDPVLSMLKAYKETVASKWIFSSPVNEESLRDPATVRKRLQTILERAGCKKIRFHDLRHTFSTVALEHGMDVKALSTIIGHVSSSTTLNVYAHVTDEMRRTATIKKDEVKMISGAGKNLYRSKQIAMRSCPHKVEYQVLFYHLIDKQPVWSYVTLPTAAVIADQSVVSVFRGPSASRLTTFSKSQISYPRFLIRL